MLRSAKDRGLYLRVWSSPDWPYGPAPRAGTAVEVRRYFGGMAHYGLLGATPSSESTIELATADAQPREKPSLPNQVHDGLPDEYRQGIERAFAIPTLTPMTILLAAHHVVDSAVVAFYDTTKVLAALMADGDALVGRTADSIIAIARGAITTHPFIR